MTTAKNKIPFPIRIPFVETLGLELHGAADGHAELRCDLHEALTNSWEVAHGGVVMTMLDVAMAVAARTAHPGGQGVATIEMKTSFMRPAEGELRAVGKLLHKTTTMAFCEATLVDGHGQLCAQASGTFKYLRGLPARDRVTRQTPNSQPAKDAS
jgi:uncharacterized protein (TIGR00369 family)